MDTPIYKTPCSEGCPHCIGVQCIATYLKQCYFYPYVSTWSLMREVFPFSVCVRVYKVSERTYQATELPETLPEELLQDKVRTTCIFAAAHASYNYFMMLCCILLCRQWVRLL